MKKKVKGRRSNSTKDIFYSSWTNFVIDVQSGTIGNKSKTIFRGQSNFSLDKSTVWNLSSSFNRIYRHGNFITNKYVEYRNVRKYIELYKASSTQFIPDTVKFIDVLQFFQHYAIPTPLIDFTSDPLIALYFALSPIPSKSVGTFGDRKTRHFTIFEIDILELEKYIEIDNIDGVSELLNEEIDTDKDDYDKVIKRLKSDYSKLYEEKKFVMDFFLEPNFKINPNLFRQKGVFLFLDSLKYSFEKIIELNLRQSRISIRKPLIIRHHIPYKSCYVNVKNNCLNVFAFLQFKQRTGIFLFENDIQGLRNDLCNGNFTYPMDCLGKVKDCDCLSRLVDIGIVI